MTHSSLHIGGLRVDALSQHETIEAIAHRVSSRQGGFVVTPNLDHIALARGNADLRRAYADAAISVADGAPLVWASHLIGTPVPARVSGADLVAPLFTRAEREGWRVYILGASPDVSRRAKYAIRARWPRLRLAGRSSAFWSAATAQDAATDPTVAAVRRARPHLVLVALGCPKQELWMHRYAAHLDGAVCLGLGGSIDFLAGAVRRAPAWMGRIGLEWAYRLAQEPRRMAHRYLWRDPLAVPPVFADALSQRLARVLAVSTVPNRDSRHRLVPGHASAAATTSTLQVSA